MIDYHASIEDKYSNNETLSNGKTRSDTSYDKLLLPEKGRGDYEFKRKKGYSKRNKSKRNKGDSDEKGESGITRKKGDINDKGGSDKERKKGYSNGKGDSEKEKNKGDRN